MTSSGNSWFRALALPGFLTVFAALFFRLPYLFPVSPSVSASYIYQFNNRVALLVFLAGATLLGFLFPWPPPESEIKDSSVSRTTGLAAVAGTVAFGAFLHWISVPQGLTGEASYFLSRFSEAVAGHTIYRDFEFAYGPLWLYLPLWTGELLHLSLISGYLLFWLFNWAIGIWLLYIVVNAIKIPSSYRTSIFLIFAASMAPWLWSQGVNYTPVRPLLAGALAMVVWTIYRRGAPQLAVAAVAAVSAAVATGVSPEYGLAFMLGTLLFFAFCVKGPIAGHRLSLAAMAVCFLAIVVWGAKAGIYTTLRVFSSGGYNFPILPHPAILCMLALFLIAVSVASRAMRSGQTETLWMYLLCVCFFSLPSSFGRADPGHMQTGAFFAPIIAALALSRYRRAWTLVATVFVFCFVAAPLASLAAPVSGETMLRVLDPSRRSELPHRAAVSILHWLHADRQREALESQAASYFAGQTTIPDLPHGAIVEAPWGMTRRGFPDQSGAVDYGYFFGLENVILPAQVDAIVHWLQAHPERELVIPPIENQWPISPVHCYSYTEGENPRFNTFYGLPWASPKRQMQVIFPLCDYILTHYAPDQTPSGKALSLWRAVAPASSGVASTGAVHSPLSSK